MFDPDGLKKNSTPNPKKRIFGLFQPMPDDSPVTVAEISARTSRLLKNDRFMGEEPNYVLTDDICTIINSAMRGSETLAKVLRQPGVLNPTNGKKFIVVILTSVYYCLHRRVIGNTSSDCTIHIDHEVIMFGTRIDGTLHNKLAADSTYWARLEEYIMNVISTHVAPPNPEE
ncbi:hypothetical protein BV22DRAFT_1051764 [Leucogyrophana mollusca]|uniref:Uncharacterized protein n=1 Tax=Leucogyrophana mollusca TaxID=85980 RepID=A0ACB8AXX1_9AGAM|nr:hypothetical protein BV22DRAFT_1051764 [Leucogyrophana mollusca]